MFFLNTIPYFLFSFIPYQLLVFLITAVFINFLAIFLSGSSFLINNFSYLFISIYLLNLILLKKLLYQHFAFTWKKNSFNYLLLFFASIVIGYRSITYAHVIDDFVFHMNHGFYSLSMWTFKNLFPTQSLDFIYPLLQVLYYFLISTIGIRLSLIFLEFSKLFWYLNLNERLKKIIFKDKSSLYFILDLIFIFFYFLPELIISHAAFMSDFYSLILTGEVVYLFFAKKNSHLLLIFMPLAILAKQSVGFFLLPLFIYIFIKDFNLIFKKIKFLFFPLLINLFILAFAVKSYIEIRNPVGLLYNNIFKSPLAPQLPPRTSDLRWGPLGLTNTVYWPFVAHYSGRYMELFIMSFKFIYLPLILIIPYIYSIKNFIIKKNKFFYLTIFLSMFLWSYLSGYGRYMTSMIFMIWLLILYDLKNKFYFIKINSFGRFFISLLLIVYLFSNIRLDYGMRNFIFEKFFPPKIISDNVNLFFNGLKFIKKDTYNDIYSYFKNRFDEKKIDSIVVVNRGISTFYAFLISVNKNIPVFSYFDNTKVNNFLKNPAISEKIKLAFKKYSKAKNVLVLSTKDYPIDFIYKTDFVKRGYRCQLLPGEKLVPQFQHDNYFNYVVEYYCLKN